MPRAPSEEPQFSAIVRIRAKHQAEQLLELAGRRVRPRDRARKLSPRIPTCKMRSAISGP